MHRLAVGQEYHPEETPSHFRNLSPSANASIRLSHFANRGVYCSLDPGILYQCSICAAPHLLKVTSEFHWACATDGNDRREGL